MNKGSEETAKASMRKSGILAPKMKLEKRCDNRRCSRVKCLRYGLNVVAAKKFAGQHTVEHTLHAKMYAQVHASSTPAKSSAMISTATSLLDAFKRRRTDPQTSATARCTSELHSGNTIRTEFHVRRSKSVPVAGISKCLKSELKVPRSAVSATAE